jgi:hypothetical protein
MGRSDVAAPKALPRMNFVSTQSKANRVAMGSTGTAAAHTLVKVDSPGTPLAVLGTSVDGDTREYRKVQTGTLVEACTSLVVLAWQLAVSRQQVESTPQSVSMRHVDTDDRCKDKNHSYARWSPTPCPIVGPPQCSSP